MNVVPLDLAAHASAEALEQFLRECQEQALPGRPVLVSISVIVDALDPLAVLESIFDPHQPHFYCERLNLLTAIAGAEVAVGFSATGAARFAAVQEFVARTLASAVAVGAVEAPFGGPHFFAAFTFESDGGPDAPFPAAQVFVPRWQVARAGEVTTAVANLLVGPGTDVPREAGRIWRAHATFRNFRYGESPDRAGPEGAPAGNAAPEVRENGNYLDAVRAAQARIAAGELEKVVVARAQDLVAARDWHPLRLLSGLRERFPDCFAFSLANGRGQNFFGASPERLVRVRQGVVETEALAGSARRGRTASEDAALGEALLRDEKERREHQHVVAMIDERLRSLGLDPEASPRVGLRRLANVQHLHTGIRAGLPPGVSLLDVVAALHPTPAVGGVPSAAAAAAIGEIEGFPRGLYAGALGWINARGGGEFFVGLRAGLLAGNRLRVYAGAGIVAGSVPERELAETNLKFNALLEALPAA